MHKRRLARTLTLTIVFLLSLFTFADAEYSNVVAEYVKAYELNEEGATLKVIEDNVDAVPSEVKALIYRSYSRKETQEKKDAYLFIAEQMSMDYKDVTGEIDLIKESKRAIFEQKLDKEVRGSLNKDNVHIIDSPKETATQKNYFVPNNLVIKAGETVRWTNSDNIAHLFASFSIIGKGGLFTPNIDPGTHWEYTFTEPGEYYYLCFIHKGMIGKIRVEE